MAIRQQRLVTAAAAILVILLALTLRIPHVDAAGPPSYTPPSDTLNLLAGTSSVNYTTPLASCDPACVNWSVNAPTISGLTFTTNPDHTVTVTGTPDTGTEGSYALYVAAANGSTYPTDWALFTLTINVSNTTTTLALTSGANPSISGDSLTFTATVTVGDNGVPLGYVGFKDDGGPLPGGECGGVPLSTTGGGGSNTPPFTAVCTISDLAVGDHHITATFFGDNADSYSPSTSDPLEQMVILTITTGTTVASNHNPSVYGQPFTLTATVSPDPGDGNGTVDFQYSTNNGGTWNDITSCTTSAIASAQATCAINGPADWHVGSYEIQAIYSGGGAYLMSTSDPITQVVNAADTTTTVTSSPNPSVYGQPFTITATVTANSPSTIDPLQDWVHFQIDGQPVDCQETWDSNVNLVSGSGGSTATCTVYDYDALENLHVGNHTIEAIYVPSSDYNGSTGSGVQVINPASTTTTATAAFHNYVSGSTVAITATVTINPPSILSFQPNVGLSGVFRGNVSFFNGSTLLCTVPLDVWGQALCEAAIVPSSTAPHSLTAIYNYDGADPDFLASSGTTDVVPALAQPTLVSATSVFPNNGQAWLLQGGGFSGASSVTVCGIPVPFTVVNDYTLLIGVPAVNAPQQCTIVVVAAGGTGSSSGTITVVPQPQPGAPVVVFPTGPSTPTCGPTDSITLSGLWTLVAWPGATGTSVADALSGGVDACGNDITGQVAVIWGFNASTQTYHAYFPDAVNVPGANDLSTLTQGLGYWIALNDPTSSTVWKVERSA
ncbi:Ig-like domain repeat protein [bacterium]|nr:Ig-like domain repeat protein [bacterium]